MTTAGGLCSFSRRPPTYPRATPPVRYCPRLGSRGGAVDALCSARRGPRGGGVPIHSGSPRERTKRPDPGSAGYRAWSPVPAAQGANVALAYTESQAFAPCSPHLSSARRGACGRLERVHTSTLQIRCSHRAAPPFHLRCRKPRSRRGDLGSFPVPQRTGSHLRERPRTVRWCALSGDASGGRCVGSAKSELCRIGEGNVWSQLRTRVRGTASGSLPAQG
jgi:hypothetical protein